MNPTLEDFGAALYGPMLLRFTLWLSDRSEEHDVRTLYFLAREGFFLDRLYHLARRLGFVKGHARHTHYLLASRRALFAAEEKTEASLREMLTYARYEGTISDLLDVRFGVPKKLSMAWGVKDAKVVLPNDIEDVLRILKSAEEKLISYSHEARAHYHTYLEARGWFAPSGKDGVVDLGYSGTIQRYLSRVAPRGPLIGYYFAVTPAVDDFRSPTNDVEACFATGCGPNDPSPAYRFSMLLEAFLTSPDGQLQGFDAGGVPQFGPGGAMQREFKMLERIYAGVERYFERMAQLAKFDEGALRQLEHTAEPTMEFCAFHAPFLQIASKMTLEDRFNGKAEHDLGRVLAALG